MEPVGVLLEVVLGESESADTCSEVNFCRSQIAIYDLTIPFPGGMSFLSTQYGWAANNVVDYEVVLANGTIVHATEKENTGERRHGEYGNIS
jgi:hypothetical protein